MGKKLECCKKKVCNKCVESSSCSSSSSSCFSSSSSSCVVCCKKYPKCNCYNVNKCAPIYYPNNCVGQYPCNPCNPCPSPCPPTIYKPSYTSYNAIITASTFNLLTPYNLFIVNSNPTSLYLPTIGSLSSYCYSKMFVISNISSSNVITLYPSASTTTTDNINGLPSITIPINSSVTVYSSYINGTGYWTSV